MQLYQEKCHGAVCSLDHGSLRDQASPSDRKDVQLDPMLSDNSEWTVVEGVPTQLYI
jgi:hypothetical protein